MAAIDFIPYKSIVRKTPQILVWLGAMVAGLLALASMRGPAPRSADAPADVFSAERALRHVEVIAREQHSVGTPANAAVRDFLLTELRRLGLEPTQESATTTQTWRGRTVPVENVIVRIAGVEPGPGILLTAHYDSFLVSPGAADDGAGVAALLETLRVLRQSPVPRRSIIVLFADGEEAGLVGARAFVDSGVAANEIGLVINFEARGNAGPSFMFETSPDNGALVAAFARVVPHPIATSVSSIIYRQMPNDTDFTVYRQAGFAGMNFAFIDGAKHYHRPTDTPANLDLRSLQHTGETALALARYFGFADRLPPPAGDAVFFNLGGSMLVHYPVTWVRPGAVVLTALALAVLILGWKRRMFDLRSLLRSLAWLVGAFIVIRIWAGVDFRITDSLGRNWRGPGYAVGILFAAGAIWGVGRISFRANGWPAQAAAALLVWLVASVALALSLPEASYVFFWPAIAGWLGLGAITMCGERARYLGIVLMALAVLLAAVITAPLLYYAFIALPLAMPGLVGLAGCIAALISVAAQSMEWRSARREERWK